MASAPLRSPPLPFPANTRLRWWVLGTVAVLTMLVYVGDIRMASASETVLNMLPRASSLTSVHRKEGSEDLQESPASHAAEVPTVSLSSDVHVPVFTYYEVGPDGKRMGEFRGLEAVHMTSHYCIGEAPFNKTCAFRNLVLLSPPTTQTLGDHAKWQYYLSVDSNASETDLQASIKAVLAEVGHLDLHSMASIRDQMARAWELTVRVFRREPTGEMINVDPKAPTIRWPGPLRSTDILESLVSDPGGAPYLYNESQADKYVGTCSLKVQASGVSCHAPDIGAIMGVPAGYILRAVHWNLGHTLLDDYVPWLSAMYDLEVGEYMDEFVQLLSSVPSEMGMLWGNNRLTKQFYKALSPKHHPLLYYELASKAVPRSVMFRGLVAGFCGRSVHGIRANYTVPGTQYRSMWKLRTKFITNFGLQSEDNDWSTTLNVSRPLKMLLIQKPDKRRILTLDQIVTAIRNKYNADVDVRVIDWVELGGLVNEAKEIARTHIMAGVDGTGMMGAFLLPPGAVYISIPTGGHHGYPAHLGDFMINGCDHIRILYYAGFQPGEYAGGIQADLTIPPEKFMPYIEEAVNLVRNKYPIPVPFMANHSPAARAFVRLANIFPEYREALSKVWLSHGPPADWLGHNPTQFWEQAIGGQAPAVLSDIMAGRVGNPPSWSGA